MDAPETPRHLPAAPYSHEARMRVIFGILTCILLASIDQTVVLPAIPQMAASLHDSAHISWVVSAYLLTTTATTPIYGKLSDQLGRRAVLSPALLVFLAASGLCALAGSAGWLILGRALQGVGGGALMAVAQSAVADVVPPRERGRYQGWFAGTWAVSTLVGPVVGGFVAQHVSWRWIFWGNVPIVLVALAMSHRALKGLAPKGGRAPIDYPGAGLLLAAVGLLLLALSMGGVDLAWGSARELGLFGGAALLFVMLWRQQGLAPAPLLPGHLLARQAHVSVISFLFSGALFELIFQLPLLLQGAYHTSPSGAGAGLMPMLFGTTMGAYGAGQFLRATGRARTALAFGLAVAIGALVPLGLWPLGAGLGWAVGWSMLAGIGLGALMPTSLVSVQSLAGGRDVGTMTGLLLLVRSTGGAFGATLAGVALSLSAPGTLAGFQAGLLGAAGALGLALLVLARMPDVELGTANR
ncbi:MDR family MFS transporter [Acidocella sp.]|uniref:MDR family MFS transporter n=1 Tax=Acidocella sp. TaxID=50710 RepID=UPI00260E0BF1|nr:MDR family MFS transporter [Acidocella sp.]